MSDWNESDHPRGQPDNEGQFVEKDGLYTGGGKVYRQDTRYSEILETDRKSARKKLDIGLTSQEWAMFYERIGKIKKEGHFVPRLKNGDMIIPIETDKSNIVVIARGTYEKPKVKYTLRCKSNDRMYEIIERLEDI